MQFAPRLPCQRHERVACGADDDHRTQVDRHAADLLGQHTPPQPLLRLEHSDGVAHAPQLCRRRQPSQPCSDDDDAAARRGGRRRHAQRELRQRAEVDPAEALQVGEHCGQTAHAPYLPKPGAAHRAHRVARPHAPRAALPLPQPQEQVAERDAPQRRERQRGVAVRRRLLVR